MSKLGKLFLVNDTTGELISQSIGAKALKSDALGAGLALSSGKAIIDTKKVVGTMLSDSSGRWLRGDLTGPTDTGGGILSIENDTGADIYVLRLIIHADTKSTGACTFDCGIGASATTVDDRLLDGIDVGTAAKDFDTARDGDLGTNGNPSTLWASTTFLTISTKTGASAGYVGRYIVEVVDHEADVAF